VVNTATFSLTIDYCGSKLKISFSELMALMRLSWMYSKAVSVE